MFALVGLNTLQGLEPSYVCLFVCLFVFARWHEVASACTTRDFVKETTAKKCSKYDKYGNICSSSLYGFNALSASDVKTAG